MLPPGYAGAVLLLTLALACAPTPPEGRIDFVRGGIVVQSGEGRTFADGRVFQALDWAPGQEVVRGGARGIAPLVPGCLPLFSVDLGDVSRLMALGGEGPDTALALSPDGATLAVGTFTGQILVLDSWTGEVRARRRLSESLVKAVAWSEDGSVLYAGEQSPDALLYALDPETLADRWTLRLARRVGSSPPPAGEDLYGVYTLPAVYGLAVLPGGDLLLAAAHGWNDEAGERLNRSQLLRVSPVGEVVATWPREPADAIFWNPQVDPAGALVALPVGRSAAGPAPELPIGGVQVLALDGLEPLAAVVPEPLEPWFGRAFVWEALDVDASRDALLMGLGDGRVLVRDLRGEPRLRLDLGTPHLAGEVPLAASVGHGLLWDDALITVTSGTHIPFGAASPELRPPATHPAENTLWVHGLDGTLRWTWRGSHVPAGLTAARDGRTLVVGAGPRRADHRADLFGILLFDLEGEGSGEDRLVTTCPTGSPVWFRHETAADGRVFAVEFPFLEEDGSLGGAYQVTALR